jgi:hypothetical protein
MVAHSHAIARASRFAVDALWRLSVKAMISRGTGSEGAAKVVTRTGRTLITSQGVCVTDGSKDVGDVQST